MTVFRKFHTLFRIFKEEIQEDLKVFKEWLMVKTDRNAVDRVNESDQNNIHIYYWRINDHQDNLGDYLAKLICNFYIPENSHMQNKKTMRWLYSVGSVLGFSCQPGVVWGSGLLYPYPIYLKKLRLTKLDIRSVRGPKTREVLLKLGKKCPEVYGDPAVLMPSIFCPENTKKEYKASLITHFSQDSNQFNDNKIHRITMITTDYEFAISEIVKSELIISSSLHGIILAEAYGVPAILLKKEGENLFKFEDYYYSTNRFDIKVAHSVEEALKMEPMKLPDLDNMRKNILNAFPYDLWT